MPKQKLIKVKFCGHGFLDESTLYPEERKLTFKNGEIKKVKMSEWEILKEVKFKGLNLFSKA